MTEIQCDDHDLESYHDCNDRPPLENNLGGGNHPITSSWRPLLPDFHHGQGSPSRATAISGELSDQKMIGFLRCNAGTSNESIINFREEMGTQQDRSEATSNINVLALLATAAHLEQQREAPTVESTPRPNAPVQEICVDQPSGNRRDNNPSPLTTSTQNGTSRGGNSSVSAPVSIANVPYHQTTDGAYLSVPETRELRGISCMDESAFEMGYDSDGELGPFFDAVLDEANWENYDEQPREGEESPQTDINPPGQSQPENITAPPAPNQHQPAQSQPENNTAPPVPNQHQLSEAAVRAMKVAELRKELKSRHKSSNGVKDALIQRLLSCMHLPPSNNVAATVAVTTNNQPVESLHHGVCWRLLEPEPTPVAEPNRIRGLVAPTTHSSGGTSEAKKFNYSETFDRDPFIATSKEWVRNSNGRAKVDQRTGEILTEEVVHEKGRPKWNFLVQNTLTEDSHPAEWFFSLVPEKKKSHHPPNVATMEQWTMYTNLKAMLAEAGTAIYKGFEPFKTEDTKKFIGLLMLHGLAPSPRISFKFQDQITDPVNGNDLVKESFGKNAEKKYKMWRLFFGIQDPRKDTPSKKTHPNWKVDPFLSWMQTVFRLAWNFGKFGSCDEQDIGFTGKHEDKQRINYKDEGDGFLVDSVAESGYTYCFFFRNQPAPSPYIRQGYSPTHARVLHLFDLLPSKNHVIGLDNLFMSAKLCAGAYKGKNQVQIHGVVRKTGRGVPTCVLQEFQKNAKEADKVRGTIKAAVLDDPECPAIVCMSYYDAKDVYFMSTSATEIKWVEKERRVYNKETQKVVSMKFLRPKIVDDYNNGMNKVDQADQLRSTYRFDLWTRTRKWWWAIWLWGIQVSLVNAYVMYRAANLYIWKKKESSLLSHYNFQKMVALHLLNPEKYPLDRRENMKRRRSDIDDSQTLRSTDNSQSTRASVVNDRALDSTNGDLRVRLSTKYFHCPTRPKAKDPSCQLHRWASNDPRQKTRGGILCCDCCNVNLCFDCFDLFHKISDVPRLKSEVLKVIRNKEVN